jgi:hypothetical protein
MKLIQTPTKARSMPLKSSELSMAAETSKICFEAVPQGEFKP